QAPLIFRGDACGIFLRRQKKWVGIDNPLALHRQLLRQEPNGHEFVLHAGAKHFCSLAQYSRNLVQPRNVILVMFHRVERNRKRQVRQAGMDAVLLVDRHLVLFQIEVGIALLEHANQQVARKLVPFRKVRARDGLDSRQELPVGLIALNNRVQRVLRQLVVISVVAVGSRPLGKIAKIGLVLLVEDRVLGSHAVSHWLHALSKNATARDQEEKNSLQTHSVRGYQTELQN